MTEYSGPTVAAHEQQITIRLIERWPAHEPRIQDPHYHPIATNFLRSWQAHAAIKAGK